MARVVAFVVGLDRQRGPSSAAVLHPALPPGRAGIRNAQLLRTIGAVRRKCRTALGDHKARFLPM
jgi:hypothetical protein